MSKKMVLGPVAFIIGLLVFVSILLVGAQIPPRDKQPTGYFVKVEALNVPVDITVMPVGTYVLYDKDGIKEIWRENVNLDTYIDDIQLENALDSWALPYIAKYERKVALSTLAKTSKIIGQKIVHKQ